MLLYLCGHIQLRIYDIRMQRRPVRDLQLEGYRITSLCGKSLYTLSLFDRSSPHAHLFAAW